MLLARASSGKAVAPLGAPTSAYIHIPFCRRRCYYCDFPIAVVGDKPLIRQQTTGDGQESRINGKNSGTIAQYVEILCQEICLTLSQGKSLETVFFGGGTPSLLSVEQLDRILTSLQRQFGIVAGAEISMEIDPATFDLEQLQGYRSAGVNRVSLGVQAFQSELLAACGRSHTVDDIYQAIDLVHQAGFQNISLDLISGLPHQTLEHWQDSLDRAIALKPTHLSCYDLTVEAGTPFSRQYKPGVTPLPSDDTTAEMYRLAQQTLTAAGYDHYEISNYATAGYQCRHNRVYWENRPFYGFGMGATSYLEGDRFARPRKTREYYEWVRAQQASTGYGVRGAGYERREAEEQGSKGAAGQESKGAAEQRGGEEKADIYHPSPHPSPHPSLSPYSPDLLLDTLMLGLRLAEGLSLSGLEEKFDRETLEKIWACLQPYHQKGWVEIQSGSGSISLKGTNLPQTGRIRLTDPEGFLFSNIILIALFEELS